MLKGAVAAAVTPLRDGRLDTAAVGPYVEFLVGHGVDGLLALGTTGEGVMFAPAHRREIAQSFLDAAAGRIQVAVHAGAQTTHDTVALAEHAASAGADAVAVIAPPYFALDEEELLEHFVAAAAACAPAPFYLYEFEARSGYAIPIPVIERLREQAPNLAGLKVSDSPWDKVSPYLLEGLDVFVGAEALLVEGLAAGAAGAVSGLAASFPDAVVPLVRTPSPELGEIARALRVVARPAAVPRRLEGRARASRRAGLRRGLRAFAWSHRGGARRGRADRRGLARLVSALRSLILAAADSPRLQRFVQRYGFRLGAARFVAGESLDAAVPVLRRLNEQGLLTNTTLLGEGVREEAETREVVDAYRELLDRIHAEGLRTNVALKLTHLGLSIDEALAERNLAELVQHAAQLGNFIRIDMEESRHVDATLRIYRSLRGSGHQNVGAVLQSYLFRSEEDLAELLPLAPNLRLVKGAYLEPPEVAYPHKRDVDAAYVRLLETSLAADGFTAVATHDETLIEHTISFAREHGIPKERFQFQMLYGVRSRLQLDLVGRGYEVLVATPYGPEWYRYLMRRLAERPANLLFLLRNLVRG